MGALRIFKALPVRGHVPFMLFEGGREARMAGGSRIGDKIEKMAVCGVHGRLQRSGPRTTDRARRQTGMTIGVVGQSRFRSDW